MARQGWSAPATAHRWWYALAAGERAPATSVALVLSRVTDRVGRTSPRPRRPVGRPAGADLCWRGSADRLGAAADRRPGPGHPHQTVWKVLRRTACRAARAGRERARGRATRMADERLSGRPAAHRHKTVTPGSPGPATHVTGDRHRPQQHGAARPLAATSTPTAIVDDHSRLAYSELHPDERSEHRHRASSQRALAFFRSPRHHRSTADDRQRLDVHASNQSLAAARLPRTTSAIC